MRIRWRGLELPSRVTVDRDSLRNNYGKFVIEPFERLASGDRGQQPASHPVVEPRGSAITKVKIRDVQHEFTTDSRA